jgi:hypothetical protein
VTEWNIQQMRAQVDRRSAFVLGGDYGAHCDYYDLPEGANGVRLDPMTDEPVPPPDGVLIDIQTANAIVAVYDALSPENREKFTAMSLEKAATVAWKLVAPRSA